MLTFGNRVQELTETAGMGDSISLEGSTTGHMTFMEEVLPGNGCIYVLESIGERGELLGPWELCRGTVSSDGKSITRETFRSSEPGNARVDLFGKTRVTHVLDAGTFSVAHGYANRLDLLGSLFLTVVDTLDPDRVLSDSFVARCDIGAFGLVFPPNLRVRFEYRPVSGSSDWLESETIVPTELGVLSLEISGLVPDTEYQYRAVVRDALNPDSQISGSIRGFQTLAYTIPAPDLVVEGYPDDILISPRLFIPAFVQNPENPDTHIRTDWQILDYSGNVLWQSLDNSSDLLFITVPLGIMVEENHYRARARYEGMTFGKGAWADVYFMTAEPLPDTVLYVGHANSPFLTGYDQDIDTFVHKGGLPSSTRPSGNVRGMAWSSNRDYIATGQEGSPYLFIFKYDPDTRGITRLPNLTNAPPGIVWGAGFDSEARTLAVAHSSSPFLTFYRRSEGSDIFQRYTGTSGTISSIGRDAKFSPDDQYLAIAHFNAPYVAVFKRQPDGETFEKLPDSAFSTPVTGHAYASEWSPDGRFLAIGHSGNPFVTVYRKNPDDTFTKLDNPDVLPAGTVEGCTFSPGQDLLVVCTTNSPYLRVYDFDPDQGGMTRVPDSVNVAPSSTSHEVRFSSDSRFMAVAHDSSPFVTIYRRTGNRFYRLPAVSVQPAGNANALVFLNVEPEEKED